MSKKIILVVVALLLIVAIGFGFKSSIDKSDDSSKEVVIELYQKDEKFDTVEFETDKATLGDALIELSENGTIKLKYSNGEYGMFIEGLGTDELLESDGSYFWIYTSSNNEACLANAGFCDAADILNIGDGDVFEFVFTDTFE